MIDNRLEIDNSRRGFTAPRALPSTCMPPQDDTTNPLSTDIEPIGTETLNDTLDLDNAIIDDPEPLREDYTPDEIYGRNDEISDYARALRRVIRSPSAAPEIYVTGPNGVGKTAVTKWILDQTAEKAASNGVTIETVHVNCDDIATQRETGAVSSYRVAIRITNKLRDQRDDTDAEPLPATGLSGQTVLKEMFDEVRAVGADVVTLVLDEVSALEDGHLINSWMRARSNGNLSDTYPGLILVGNSQRWLDETLTRTARDVFRPTRLSFAEYTPPELRAILTARADAAFFDDVDAEAAIARIAAEVGKVDGSARRAIRMLRAAADAAEDDADVEREVLVRHVDTAADEVRAETVGEKVRRLTDSKRAVAAAVVVMQCRGATPVAVDELYEEWYVDVCDRMGEDPRSVRSVRRFLDELEERGVVECRVETRGSVPVQEYSVSDVEPVVEALRAAGSYGSGVLESDVRAAVENGVVSEEWARGEMGVEEGDGWFSDL